MLTRSSIKVACGVSGGVDSAVSAWLLKQAGYNVVGVYMQNWDRLDETADERQCSTESDYEDARFICSRIGIPLESVRFVREYWLRVFERTLATYQRGWTPNPDILCNRHVKFDCFAKYARDTLKVDLIATGHYARTALVNGRKFSPVTLNGEYELLSLSGRPLQVSTHVDQHYDSVAQDLRQCAAIGSRVPVDTRSTSTDEFIEEKDATRSALLCSADLRKDQSFWLAQIDARMLRSTLFPVGDFHKQQVKRIAERIGLARIAAKRESVGLCFVGKRREFSSFLAGYVSDRQGNFCGLTDDTPLGEHGGVHRFTLGQRVVLPGVRTSALTRADQIVADAPSSQCDSARTISNTYQKPTALFVAKLDATRNLVHIVCGTNHPALFTRHVTCVEPVWFVRPTHFPLRCYFRWQNKFKFQHCTVYRLQDEPNACASQQAQPAGVTGDKGGSHYRIELDRPLRAVSAGQYAVLYSYVESLGTFECIGSMLIVGNEPTEYQLGIRHPIEWNVEDVQIDDQEIVLR